MLINKFKQLARNILWFTTKHSKINIFIGLVIALICLMPSIWLYSNLKSGLEELLPKTSPSIKALDSLHARLGDNLQLTLYMTGEKPEELRLFADKLFDKTMKMENAPRFIDYKATEVQDFFNAKKPLFIEHDDLKKISAKISYEFKSKNPFSLGLFDDELENSKDKDIDLDKIFEKYEDKSKKIKTFPTGYYEDLKTKALIMIFYPSKGVSDYKSCISFRGKIKELANEVLKENNLTNVNVQYTGDVESIIQEQESLQADLMMSAIIVVVAESILLFFYYKWIGSVFALAIPLLIGTLFTFMCSFFAIGSVNASTAFLGSIIVGNGVNPGIILLARYLEERKRKLIAEEAIRIAVKETYLATFVASMAAALAYGVLMFTAFRGYSQFGFMGGIGMATCWITTYFFGPSAVLIFDKIFPYQEPEKRLTIIDRFFGKIGSICVDNSRKVVALAVLLTVASTAIVIRFAHDPFEYDTTKLRSKWATQKGGYLEIDEKSDQVLGRKMLPMVVLLDKNANVNDISDKYKKLLSDSSILGEVFNIHSMVPGSIEEQKEKVKIINEIKEKIKGKKLSSLDKEKREFAEAVLKSEVTPFEMKDIPESIRRQFREVDGSEGKIILLLPKFETNTRDGRNVLKFAKEVRSIDLPEGTIISGSQLVFADLLAAIAKDGPLATVLAFVAVVLLSLILAKGGKSGAFNVTFSLLLGILMTAALAAFFDMRVNFLNFIAIPITFGIGLDYAANVYGRYRVGKQDDEGIKKAVGFSGSAVAVCSMTTIIGYASLLFSRNGALFSFGLLAIVGEVVCLFAAIIFLPALLSLTKSK